MPRPFGYLPGEMGVVDLMVELRESGLGYQAIANHLNNHEVPTRENAIWWPLTVRDIVRRYRPDLCPPRESVPLRQQDAARHVRDKDRQRKRRASARAETVAA